MFNLALDAKLRGCDLVKLPLGDIDQGGAVRQLTFQALAGQYAP